jgi:hypothetical protein
VAIELPFCLPNDLQFEHVVEIPVMLKPRHSKAGVHIYAYWRAQIAL